MLRILTYSICDIIQIYAAYSYIFHIYDSLVSYLSRCIGIRGLGFCVSDFGPRFVSLGFWVSVFSFSVIGWKDMYRVYIYTCVVCTIVYCFCCCIQFPISSLVTFKPRMKWTGNRKRLVSFWIGIGMGFIPVQRLFLSCLVLLSSSDREWDKKGMK